VIKDNTNSYLLEQSSEFIRQFGSEKNVDSHTTESRIKHIHYEISKNSSYVLTSEELAFGARLAWRNANRCIGRLFWKSLHVFDCRNVTNPKELFERLCEHLIFATNGGAIRSAITIFPPSNSLHQSESSKIKSDAPLTILNHQLFRYAGYIQADGSIVGDPMNVELTQQCMSLGWEPSHYEGRDGRFDLLPLVVKDTNGSLHWFTWPREVFLEVPITHDAYPQLDALNLRWYAVPVLSDMVLEIGGLQFPTAPFNGWYMGTEIGARNLADTHRYNLLPKIAACLGLEMTTNRNLWKDQALVILNQAVLQSYERAGVKMVDHHTASEQHLHFERTEVSHQREVHGDWSWLVPPMSGASSPLFHKEYTNIELTPAFRIKANTSHPKPATKCPISQVSVD
jgi:nitric-oxide synthase, bacterial